MITTSPAHAGSMPIPSRICPTGPTSRKAMRGQACLTGVANRGAPVRPPRCGRRGQAMLEVAITGSLALVALAFFIQIALRQNYQQEIEQQTFRRALRMAHSFGDEERPAISYHHFRDRQLPDPADAFGIIPRTLTTSTSSVTWGEFLTLLADDADSAPLVVVDLNTNGGINQRRNFNAGEDGDLEDNQPLVSSIDRIINVNESLSSSEVKQDASGRLTTRLGAVTTELTTLTINTKGDDAQVFSQLDTNVSINW